MSSTTSTPPSPPSVLGDVWLQAVADVVGVPVRTVQQPPETIRCAVPGALGRPPAVSAADGGEQAPHMVPRPAPQAGTARPVTGAEEKAVEFPFPGGVRMFVDHARAQGAGRARRFQ